ncbi:MAG: AAA family ATPase [Methylotenera sp.]|nr:AAA family ATPase [Methylotenera sp.]
MLNESLPPLIKALLEPKCYSHPVQQVELVATHISWLLIAGEFVYKIKKPITLPFLDYGTLEKRHIYCEAELRLNQRYAPDIYLEVVAIMGTPENPHFNGEGSPVEYAVKMRRFDEAGRLDHVCDRSELQPKHVSDLAEAIVNFHRDAAKATVNTRYGSPEKVIEPALENFNELYTLVSDNECLTKLDCLQTWTRAEFERLSPNFSARKADGWVRECHGDLHLGNIVLMDGQVRLFDCIEFNEDFRWIDVVSDIAFTYIDLLDHHQPGLAGWFLKEWLSRSGDFDAMPVLRFYAVYRALVRAKVAAISAKQRHGDISDVWAYIALAEQIISTPKPKLIITHGLAGCGKTTAAKNLLFNDNYGCTIHLRSDVERKRLFGLAAVAKSNSPLGGGIYVQEAHQLTYRRLYDLAEGLLIAGWSVIIDAAFLKHAERSDFHALATKTGAEFCILAPQTSLEQLRLRISDRLKKGHDASEATLEVLEQQLTFTEPLDEDERHFLIKDTSRGP